MDDREYTKRMNFSNALRESMLMYERERTEIMNDMEKRREKLRYLREYSNANKQVNIFFLFILSSNSQTGTKPTFKQDTFLKQKPNYRSRGLRVRLLFSSCGGLLFLVLFFNEKENALSSDLKVSDHCIVL